jgi:hypothetical protein
MGAQQISSFPSLASLRIPQKETKVTKKTNLLDLPYISVVEEICPAPEFGKQIQVAGERATRYNPPQCDELKVRQLLRWVDDRHSQAHARFYPD